MPVLQLLGVKCEGDVKDIDELWQFIKRETLELTGNATGDKIGAEVRALGEKIQLQLEQNNQRWHYMILNMQQDYTKKLKGFSDFQTHYIHGILFGVWIFEYGKFENCGIGSHENWMFGGYGGGSFVRHGQPVQLFRKAHWPFSRHHGEGRKVTFSKI